MNENGEMVPAGVPGELCTRGKIVRYNWGCGVFGKY